MKSLVEEASTVAKALEKAWMRAGKPQEFSVKIFEEQETNFLGFTKKSAKVGIFFEEPQSLRSHYNSSENRPSRQGQNRKSNQNTRPAQQKELRERVDIKDSRERETRYERPEKIERYERTELRTQQAKAVHVRPEEIRTISQDSVATSGQNHNAAHRQQRLERPHQSRNRRPQNNNFKQKETSQIEESTKQQVTQEITSQPAHYPTSTRHIAAQTIHHEVRQDVRPEGHVVHRDPRMDVQVSAKAPAHNIEHESTKHSTQSIPVVRKVLKVSTRCYSHPKKIDESKP